ncbi:MAG: SDR family oxidoreductase [Pseudomonadota bacterium]
MDRKTNSTSPIAGLMAGKRGLICGIANDHSIGWDIARTLHDAGAELALSYQNASFKRRVEPLGAALGSSLILPCDVTEPGKIESMFAELQTCWDTLDFVVHALAWSDRDELKGRYIDTSHDNFRDTLSVSCYSFTELARHATKMMVPSSALLTLTFEGAGRVMPSYNVMGVAKAALEASVRYLAADLGADGIRVNAISAGPMRTLAGSAISGSRFIYGWHGRNAPLGRNLETGEIGKSALYLLSDMASAVTGEILYVDAGYHTVGMVAIDER